jgi:hypothetical protein
MFPPEGQEEEYASSTDCQEEGSRGLAVSTVNGSSPHLLRPATPIAIAAGKRRFSLEIIAPVKRKRTPGLRGSSCRITAPLLAVSKSVLCTR